MKYYRITLYKICINMMLIVDDPITFFRHTLKFVQFEYASGFSIDLFLGYVGRTLTQQILAGNVLKIVASRNDGIMHNS